MQTKIILYSLMCLLSVNLFSQTENETRKPFYLTFQTGGVIVDNRLNLRSFGEYQKDLKGNWQYGISYEHSRDFQYVITKPYPRYMGLLSFNIYYKFNLIKDKLYWTAGLGVGGAYLNWLDYGKNIGATINSSLILNIRIFKRIYIETSPLLIYRYDLYIDKYALFSPFSLILPIERAYFWTLNTDNPFGVVVLPFGIKVKF